MPTERQHELLGLDIQELTSLVENSGEPSYRARQLFQAIYGERLQSPEEISTLPQSFRRALREQGYAMLPSEAVDAVIDISAPILQRDRAVGTLTIPFVERHPATVPVKQAIEHLRKAVDDISAALLG